MEVLARLDKTTGLRVLCGWPTCHGELACIQIVKGKRVLCMLDGWKHKARGHWAQNQHSAHRAANATDAVRRGELARELLASRRRPRLRQPIPDDKDTFRSVFGLNSDNHVIAPVPKVGILADCPIPSCGRVNLLLGSNLDVATETSG